MIKKLIPFVLASSLIALSGCSILEEVNGSLTYATESTEYINELQTFGQEASSLVQDAATNPEAKAELEEQIIALEANIKEFNEVEAPSIAADLDASIEERNEQLLDAINTAMENGELSLERLQNTEIFTTINEMTELMNQIEQLEL